MNRQEVFNKVATHLLWQYAKSQDISSMNKSCLYYDKDTHHTCAIGCLIPKRFINNKNNIQLIDSLVMDEDNKFYNPRLKNYLKILSHDDVEFLLKLQEIHDQKEVSDWVHYLIDFAYERGLLNFTPRKTSFEKGKECPPQVQERLNELKKQLQEADHNRCKKVSENDGQKGLVG